MTASAAERTFDDKAMTVSNGSIVRSRIFEKRPFSLDF